MGDVEIRGRGVAAACCAHLLRAAGFDVTQTDALRARVPAVVVSAATQSLMEDVSGRGDLFRGLPQIERRVVRWGPKPETVELPHRAIVFGEEELVSRMEQNRAASPHSAPEDRATWTVFAGRPLPAWAVERHFGTRRAVVVAAEVKTDRACWVESLATGWLFLMPGWLVAVGGAPEDLLAQSRLVAEQIQTLGEQAGEFPAYPRIADPLCAPGQLACGGAAMAFDPICGDGTGNAVREAILAAAVIRAAAGAENADSLAAHYRARLIAGFRRHLELSLEFYRAGNLGPWWEEEIRAMERGLAWCGAAGEFRYRLEGFKLIPVSRR